MELQEILSVAIGTLVVLVIAHFAVFWVVRTLYPPMIISAVAPPPVFTPPTEISHVVDIPTHAPPVPVETASKEGERKGPPPPEDTSIRRKPGVDNVVA